MVHKIPQGMECKVCQGVECKVYQGVECKVCQGVECKVCQGLEIKHIARCFPVILNGDLDGTPRRVM